MNSSSAALEFPDLSSHNLDLDVTQCTYITLASNEKAFNLILADLANSENQSFALAPTTDGGDEDGSCCDEGQDFKKKYSSIVAGLGLHNTSFDGHSLYVLLRTHGLPVGTD